MKKNLLLAVFSGLLLWIAWPPTAYTTFLLFVGLVPMLIAIENIINSPSTKKGQFVFATTFIGFFIWNSLSIYWVYNSLKTIGPLVAIPITLIPYSLGPLLMAGTCWLYYRMRLSTARGWSLAALVCFWIAYEYLHQSWDLKFPWMTLGNGFAVSHKWVQWYEYTGVYGGTIWIWLCNIFLFLLYISLRESRPKVYRSKLTVGFALSLILPLGYSLVTYYSYQEQPNPSNVVVVQPNVDPYTKFDLAPDQEMSKLTRLSASVAQPNTEYFIWPETAIAEDTDEDRFTQSTQYGQMRQFLKNYRNGNLITGVSTYRIYNDAHTPTARFSENTHQYFDVFNTAVQIENSDRVQFYHKSKLVPGAEAMPFGAALSFLTPVFEHLGGSTGGFGSQPDADVFYSQSGIGADPVICYETIWGDWISHSVRKGAQFIAIITNDGWWENTSGKDQHIDYAKLRAIENRRWVCRSANTGISGFINQRGDVIQRSGWWVEAALKQEINLNSELTFYTKHGDYLAKGGCGLALLGMIFIVFRRLKPKRVAAA
ncbi:apolipoprotein N-acyltransferase [Mucilaginibacter daejeonensis]|uniref:apolipoprotein N-acyltransferase n=1 Tax=Mucilaginibacter daejeonensis TaxID=398049 RepID=UPI001D16FC0F|nr:apolipoprotein N-acyltransferase [Mucilaginibacter daejeonensis]UEG53155.1 apolipoprotein N-acyltransferase [Mucilaginibacter daejeonensis]